MGEVDELEMLLGEIPYATSPLNLQNHPSEKSNGTLYGMYHDDQSNHFNYTTCGSPVSGFSLPSDWSSSSFLSNSNDSWSPPLFEGIPSHGNSHYSNVLPSAFNVSDNALGSFGYENSASELNLTDHMSRFCIGDETDSNRFHRTFDRSNHGANPNGFQFVNHSVYGANRFNAENFGNFAYNGGVLSENSAARLNGFQFGDNTIYGANSTCELTKANIGYNRRGFSSYGVPQLSVLRNHHSINGETQSAFLGPFSGMNSPGFPYTSQQCTTKNTYLDYLTNHLLIGSAALSGQHNRMSTNVYNMPHNARVRSNFGGILGGFGVSSTSEDCLNIWGDGLSFVRQKEFGHLRASNFKDSSPIVPPSKYESLVEVRGYIHIIAKDQNGCRFLQRIFDEGTPQDMQIVFNEIIGHVVELMVDPFGNYLMQKLLEVCNEEQRMQILLTLTEKPGQLIRISLNTHGTRVVQKLIETLKTRQEVSLVISALEPGFLALIKDLNGNHVIKQCLQSLSIEDNKFIFDGASKHCVEVATHQHGCCVLQCCISLLTGSHREKLVQEISANGILLAQDEYGNFVIQFILELGIPSAKSSFISQFEGNFVHLSTQKFSSHVVEKCLAVFDYDLRSKIIQELLSAPHFKQLLQDPYANYVIGKALKLTEGSRLYNVLVEAIQCHECTLRNCPYSKKLLSALKHYRETTTSRKAPSQKGF